MLSADSGCAVPAFPVYQASATSMPVQVTTVDGLVSTFTVNNILPRVSDNTQYSSAYEGSFTGEAGFRVGEGSSVAPMVLDFSAAVTSDVSTAPAQISTAATRRIRQRVAREPVNRQRARAEQPHGMDSNNSPAQGPIVPPQREGAPIEYKYFGRCDQVCQHCHATFWLEEKRTGLPASAAPQYQRCCVGGRAILRGFCPANDDTPRFLQMYIYDTEHEVQNMLSHSDPYERQSLREDVIEGLIEFLDGNNALVRLFRTARDKLREADIPSFHIRLFGVVGANQYELPTADSIGAIVYKGGPESATDYDVVIERHSREPESVNKLHPQYMALQFPILFIYGEEGYHLNLTLKNSDTFDTQHEKKMTMKIYYAYQLFDRLGS
ncbi:DNA helicase Pif1-like protein [Artemisia annua]|uniref:DNA helicase Pif1-like protein n=1 Tax=Artemisia annua TaxID=35608 RepID=A0A2U1PRK8_ARTAN|nr:DNA helicase Pif1-like protein [Artemisia annua]